MASSDNLKNLITNYTTNRSQNDSKANKKSSRSHAIFKIECDSLSVAIVDLAGSERLNKTYGQKHETTYINKSLLTLGKCIHAFRDGSMIPFRESNLTKVLTEYFSSRYKIFMIAHINRSGEMFHENLNVLGYAAISTNVKPLNQSLNRSIMMSAQKKNNRSKSKSCLKKKETIEEDESKKDVSKPSTPISKLKSEKKKKNTKVE